MMKGKNLQTRLLYPARISLRIDRDIKSFTDKQKPREFTQSNQLYNKCYRNFSKRETKEKKRTYKTKHQTIEKIVIVTYILIITLIVNGLNAPTKRHRMAEWIQKQDLYICCLQKPTSDLGTHTD